MNTEAKKVILAVVAAHPGILGIDLTCRVVKVLCRKKIKVPDLAGVYAAMVADGDMREIEYIKPGSMLVKSVFFPAGTRLRIINPEPDEACPACQNYESN